MKKKIIISIWDDPCNYINLLFLINYFLDKKYEIILICQFIQKNNDFYYFVNNSNNLKVLQINKKNKIGYLYFFCTKLFWFIKFKPQTLISINFISLFFSYFTRSKKMKWIYYNFDFNVTTKFNINNFFEKKIIPSVDVVLIPSRSRVQLYKKKFFRKKNIYEIKNCFSKNFKIKKFDLKKINKNLKKKNYLVRLGSFYKYHFLEEIALSTLNWKKNIYLVLAGKSYHKYFGELKNLKKKYNLHKVILIENVSYKTWFILLQNDIAGFALYESINTSHKLMGGTSQKLNNYIFANIPSFINSNNDFLKFNKKYNTSIIIDNPKTDIDIKVNFLLNNKRFYNFKINKNKIAFKREFNFEKQIKKIEKFII